MEEIPRGAAAGAALHEVIRCAQDDRTKDANLIGASSEGSDQRDMSQVFHLHTPPAIGFVLPS